MFSVRVRLCEAVDERVVGLMEDCLGKFWLLQKRPGQHVLEERSLQMLCRDVL